MRHSKAATAFVTKDQLERARQYSALEYVLRYEADQFNRVGRGYRLKDDDAFAVGEKGWYCHKNKIGSRTALDYLVKIKGYGLVDAVCFLLNERPHEYGDKATYAPKPKARSPTVSTQHTKPPPERTPFSPPRRNKDNRRVIAYLQSRGIDKDLILACINHGSLYENAVWHNCVFTGKDENGKPRFATQRGTTSAFKCDAEGSDKRYGFVIPPENPSTREVAIFEAPIDCLSHQTLCKQGFIPPFDGWRLSLGGTSDLALKHFLETHTGITHCVICTDNDEPGNSVVEKIAEMPGITVERSLPVVGNDWNDSLQALQKAERAQHRARQHNALNL
jgi:hypothetical protein